MTATKIAAVLGSGVSKGKRTGSGFHNHNVEGMPA
jgi:hypothetical protein